jgi:hypothetical protein
MKEVIPALLAHTGAVVVAILFLVELSMPEEYVLFLLVIMCILLF